jgi:dienelactone hydrolase
MFAYFNALQTLNRRQLLALAAATRLRADSAPASSELSDYFSRTLAEFDSKRQQKLRAVRTAADLAELRKHVRRTLISGIGAFPERTPLNVQQTGELVRPAYVIEKLVLQSRPGFFVTANLYRPRSTATKRPAVVQVCGHYLEGKATPDYAKACAGLAMKGFVALIFDPPGQGERITLRDASGKPGFKSATAEHVIAGGPTILLGRTLANYMVWDVMRVFDYLESRPDVDSSRMGILGHSGGGMLTLLAAPLEPRIRAAMSCCAVTSFYHKTQALLNADPEQIVPGVYAAGVDHPELIASVAPRAFLIGAVLRDFVPLAGTRRTFDEVKALFEVAGVPGNVEKVESDNVHLLDQNLREACYGWMMRHLSGESGDTREPEITVETPETLRCTRTGFVSDLQGSRSVWVLNGEEARRLAASRRQPTAAVIRARLGLSWTGFSSVPPLHNAPAPNLILVSEQGSSSQDARSLVGQFNRAGFRALAVDLPGWGDRKPNPPGTKAQFAWDDFFAWRSFEMGRSLLALRVSELLAVPRAPKSYLVGIDAGGIVALHAAALDNSIAGVATWRSLNSWANALQRTSASEMMSSFLPSVLKDYNIPDLIHSLAPRPVLTIGTETANPATEILKGLPLL